MYESFLRVLVMIMLGLYFNRDENCGLKLK